MSTNINSLEVSVDEIEQNLSLYLKRVQAGETVVIVTASGPLAEIRPIGLCAGEFSVPDDFDAPLSEHILQEFKDK